MKIKNKTYANGQITHEIINDVMIYYFRDGTLKATGPYINEQMQGEWHFYRRTGQLWQVSNFKNNEKHGSWIRYNKNNEIEYNEIFEMGKIQKK